MSIKAIPEDFLVEEILDDHYRRGLAPQPRSHALYLLRKRSLTTPEAASMLARKLGVKPGDVAWAGLKDKHAATTQHVTVKLPRSAAPPPRSAESQQFSAQRLGYVDAAIDSAAIAANRFHLTIRALVQQQVNELNIRARRLSTGPGELLAINYFGEQRFGSARTGAGEHGGFLAPLLIRGEYEQALKIALATPHRKDVMRLKQFKRAVRDGWGRWPAMVRDLPDVPERRAVEHLADLPGDFAGAFATLPYICQQMCIDAYQSLLWNRIAHRLIRSRCGPADRLLAAESKFGELLFPYAGAVPAELLGLDLPLLGENSELREPWRSAAESVLSEEQITPADLRLPGLRRPEFREVPRPLFMRATNFKADPAAPDEMQTAQRRLKQTLHFDLPRGSYATVLLRALGS